MAQKGCFVNDGDYVFPYFERIKIDLSDHNTMCVYVSLLLIFEFLNQSWYVVYHGT
jgi:hypothetical protein